jgi:hypothetical protein
VIGKKVNKDSDNSKNKIQLVIQYQKKNNNKELRTDQFRIIKVENAHKEQIDYINIS